MFLSNKKGLRDWWLQRISAFFLIAYTLPLIVLWVYYQPHEFMDWQKLLFNLPMRLLGVFAYIAMVVHAGIGFWVVATDYIHVAKARGIIIGLVHLTLILSAMASVFLLIKV